MERKKKKQKHGIRKRETNNGGEDERVVRSKWREREGESQGEEKKERGKAITLSAPSTFLHTTQPTLQMHVSRQFSAPFNRLLLYALVVHGLYTYIVAHRVPRKPEIPLSPSAHVRPRRFAHSFTQNYDIFFFDLLNATWN